MVLRYFDDDTFEVAVGPMKMKVARDDFASVVARAGSNPVAAARARGINVSLAREDDSVPTEINVIGQTVDEATGAWRSLWTARSWPARCAFAWCTAVAWEFCAKRCGSFCKAIRTLPMSASRRRTKAAVAQRLWN